jgi:hypothetical protein
MGKSSSTPLTLYALSDLNDPGTTNINLMTHLERPRVEYLMGRGNPGPYTLEYYEKRLIKPTRIKHLTVVEEPTN